MTRSDSNEGDRTPNKETHEGERAPAAEAAEAVAAVATTGQGLTGYVKSVRDDLTAFVSSEREAAGCAEGGAVGRTLAILARLGKDLRRMVRLRGGVEHQVRFTVTESGRAGDTRGKFWCLHRSCYYFPYSARCEFCR